MWRQAGARGASAHKEWANRHAAAPAKAEFDRRFAGDLPKALAPAISAYKQKLAETKPVVATRKASEDALEVINGVVPETIGGSADLTGSNNTKTSQTRPITAGAYGNRYIHFGIREHGMAAAINGMALHGGVIPYGGTFLVFSDYARPSMRLASLMGIRSIFVMTHDSIGLGEDGPTHQPVEHLAALRAIPNHVVFRPADAVEAADSAAFKERSGDRYFIFDVQLHYVGAGYDPGDAEAGRKGAVSKQALLGLRRGSRRLNPKLAQDRGTMADLAWANMVKEVFLDSETDIGLISTPPGPYPQEAVVPPREMTHIRDRSTA